MGAVVDPGSVRLDKLAHRNHRRMTDSGDEIALASRLDAQHAEAVLRVMEGYPVDQAGQDLIRARG